MKVIFIGIFLAFAFLQCTSQPSNTESDPQLIEKTEKIRDLLIKEDYSSIPTDFNKQMIEALKPEKIEEVWKGIIKQIGNYESNGEIISDQIQGYRVVYSILKFEKAPIKLKVVFDENDQVGGLFFVPVNAK